MPRPKKAPAEKLTRRLPHVRCTQSEHDMIKAKAAQTGLALSEFVRRMTLDGQVTVQQSPYDFHTVDQLRRIGINLNQIARVANSTGEVSPALETVCGKLETILDNFIENL